MKSEYTHDRLNILYECFRHKIAHLAYPYAVFDTLTKPKTFPPHGKQRRVIWTVYASPRRPAIEIEDLTAPLFLKKTPTPWAVSYNCRIR
jgi:hypothetical protein